MLYKCVPCNKTFKSPEQQEEHKKSKKHKKNEKEYQKKNPEADSDSIFQSISQNQDKSFGAPISETGEIDGKTKLSVEEDSEKSKQPPRLTAVESLRCCLFCNKECDGLKKCIDHMRVKHSFTILDVDCLVDLKGLLSYMAQRIQLGSLCLFCSKQFSGSQQCQQHMLDKSHCTMNMEDEDEYVDFYDFSKTYENHPLLIAGPAAIKEESKEGEDEWDDLGDEDLDSGDDADENSSDPSFVVVSEKESTDKSFTIVDKPVTDSSTDGFAIDSATSAKTEFKERKGLGKTKEQVFLGLDIKKAKLLDTGEVQLGNGKVMGHRQFNYIYKQKPRIPDTRESVVINKIALEYRKLRAIQNGGIGGTISTGFQDPRFPVGGRIELKARKLETKAFQREYLKCGHHNNLLQHHFKDPTGHL